MQYLKVTLFTTHEQEILIALLSDIGYEGFEETEEELYAYIPHHEFDAAELLSLISPLHIPYQTTVIPDQNWNSLWESNFEPVVIDNFCTIRAHFHAIEAVTPYEIIITPKMSFGTGHHATTRMMVAQMKDIDFTRRSVLDFGTGTGVLAILAEKRGAANIMAIDIDDWCVENALENVAINNCSHINIQKGTLDDISGSVFDVVLANINRNILLHYTKKLYHILNNDGIILLSGLLSEDKAIIIEAYQKAGFEFKNSVQDGNWIALILQKR